MYSYGMCHNSNLRCVCWPGIHRFRDIQAKKCKQFLFQNLYSLKAIVHRHTCIYSNRHFCGCTLIKHILLTSRFQFSATGSSHSMTHFLQRASDSWKTDVWWWELQLLQWEVSDHQNWQVMVTASIQYKDSFMPQGHHRNTVPTIKAF